MTKSFRAFYALHRAHTAVFRASDKLLKKSEGILTAHQSILFVLGIEDGLPSTIIANRTGMSKSRLTGLLDALERKDLIRRERGEQDGRQQLIFLQAAGRELIDRTKGTVNRLNARLLNDFSDEEQSVIQRFLENAEAQAASISEF